MYTGFIGVFTLLAIEICPLIADKPPIIQSFPILVDPPIATLAAITVFSPMETALDLVFERVPYRPKLQDHLKIPGLHQV